MHIFADLQHHLQRPGKNVSFHSFPTYFYVSTLCAYHCSTEKYKWKLVCNITASVVELLVVARAALLACFALVGKRLNGEEQTDQLERRTCSLDWANHHHHHHYVFHLLSPALSHSLTPVYSLAPICFSRKVGISWRATSAALTKHACTKWTWKPTQAASLKSVLRWFSETKLVSFPPQKRYIQDSRISLTPATAIGEKNNKEQYTTQKPDHQQRQGGQQSTFPQSKNRSLLSAKEIFCKSTTKHSIATNGLLTELPKSFLQFWRASSEQQACTFTVSIQVRVKEAPVWIDFLSGITCCMFLVNKRAIIISLNSTTFFLPERFFASI